MGQLTCKMKAIQFAILILVSSTITNIVSAQTSDRKVAAILIGNHSYHSASLPALKFPANDVEKMGTLCQDLKFDTVITTYEKETKKAFFDDVRLYKTQVLKPRHITDLVIYYSGHGGIGDGGESFLVPTEFEPSEFLSMYNQYAENATLASGHDLMTYVERLQGKPDCTPYETEFKKKLRYLKLIESAASVSMLCDSLKEFNLLFISDACRTPLSNATRGASTLAGLPVDDKGYVTEWLKTYAHNYSGRADKLIADIRDFTNYVNKTISDFDKNCGFFNQTLSDPGARKPVTILYGTNFYNSATELSNIFSGAFTKCFVQCIRDSKASPIIIDDNFIKTATQCINTSQKPILEGVRSFGLSNPFIKTQPVNATAMQKAFSNRSFKAVRMTLPDSAGKPVDLLTKHVSVMQRQTQKEVKQMPDFLHFFDADTSLARIPGFNVATSVRLPQVYLSFDDNKLSFYFEEQSTFFGGNDYTFNKKSLSFSVINLATINGSNITKKIQNFPLDGEYAIINDSTISLKKTLSFPYILNADQIIIKRISVNYDTIVMSIADSYTNKILTIQLAALDNYKKIYAGARIPYAGTLSDTRTRLVNKVSFTKNDSFYPTNAVFNNTWRNGKYKCVIRLKVNVDNTQLAADTAVTHKFRNDFLRLQVNNVSNCDNPLYPGANTTMCFKMLNEFKYGIEMFQQAATYTSLTVNFEVIDHDPSKLKLSIPFYCTTEKNYIKNVDIESVTLECIEEYSDQDVNKKLAAIAPAGTPVPVAHQ
jgi:hypothetical protein